MGIDASILGYIIMEIFPTCTDTAFFGSKVIAAIDAALDVMVRDDEDDEGTEKDNNDTIISPNVLGAPLKNERAQSETEKTMEQDNCGY